MAVVDLEHWYFDRECPGRTFYVETEQQADNTWNVKIERYTEQQALLLSSGMLVGITSALDLGNSDIDTLRNLHQLCSDYSGVEDFTQWIQLTYPGYDLWVGAETAKAKDAVVSEYVQCRTVYTTIKSVMGEEMFESFLALDI